MSAQSSLLSFFKKWLTALSAVVFLLVSSNLLTLTVVQGAGAAWYDAAWGYRIPVTIDHTKIPTDVVDFPLLITFTIADPTKPQTDGDDFVITLADGVTQLHHEIESWNGASGSLVAWVKVPSLSSTVDTVLYVYYGNAVATNQQSISSVWSNGFRMVQHMDTSAYLDRSGNGTNGVQSGGATIVPSRIGLGTHVDGIDDRVTIADNAALNFTDVLTVSLWFKTDVVPNLADGLENGILGKPNDFWSDSFGFYFDLTGKLRFFVDGYTAHAPAATVSATSWMYVVGVYDGARVRLYVNGVEVSNVAFAGAIVTNNKPLNIGRLSNNQYNTDGTFDEVRVANSARSAGYIATEYANQSAPQTFIAVGTEQSYELTRYVTVVGANSLVAGTTQALTLTVKDGTGAAAAGFTGDAVVTVSGAHASEAGNQPTCTDKNGSAVPLGNVMTLSFAGGVATCTLTLYQAESVSIDAVVGSYSSLADANYDADISVHPGPLHSFGIAASSTITYGQNFTLVSTARDAYFNVVTTSISDASVVASSGVLDQTNISGVEFLGDGVATSTFVVSGDSVSSPVTITVRSGAAAGSISVAVTNIPAPQGSTEGGGTNYTIGPGPTVNNGGVGGPPPEEVLVPTTSTPPLQPDVLPQPTPVQPIEQPFFPTSPQPTFPARPVVARPSLGAGTGQQTAVPSRFRTLSLERPTVFDEEGKVVALKIETDQANKRKVTLRVHEDVVLEVALKLKQKEASVIGYIVQKNTNETRTPGEAGEFFGEPLKLSDAGHSGIFTGRFSTALLRRDTELEIVVAYDDPFLPRQVFSLRAINESGTMLGADSKPVQGAFVTLFRLNPETKKYERWRGEKVGQANPVLTENSGHYYFAPPPGEYRLEAVSETHLPYVRELTIARGQVVNLDGILAPKKKMLDQGSISRPAQLFRFFFKSVKELVW